MGDDICFFHRRGYEVPLRQRTFSDGYIVQFALSILYLDIHQDV